VTQSPLRRVLSVIRRQVDPDASGPLADERLLARFAKNGDPSAFELLVWRHGTMVLGTCRRILGDHHLAEDAFQATFLALARKPRAVRSGAALPGWLHRVAKRIAVRARQDSAKRLKRDYCVARSEFVAAPDVLSAEATAIIDEEIDRLPEWQRRAVVLCYLDGHTAEQASALLGCPRGTVLSRLAAAKERLRTRLTRRGLALPAGGFAISLGAAEVSAAMVSTTAKAVLGGGASVQVIGWAQGVIYAMFISKIKFATAAVLTTGMIGAGVGWVAVPGNGPGIVGETQAAQVPVIDQIRRERDAAVQQRLLAEEARAQAEKAMAAERAAREMAQKAEAELQTARARLQEAQAQLKLLEDRHAAANKGAERNRDDRTALEHQLSNLMKAQMEREEKRSNEAVQLRLQLAQQEERFNALDRDHAMELERLTKAMTQADARLTDQKQRLSEVMEGRGKDHPDVDRQKRALNDAAERFERLQAELKERQSKVLNERMQARATMVQLEEEAKRIERRAAMEEREIAEKRAAIQERLRGSGGSAKSSGDGRLADIDRKLDTLIREFAELRREMKK
jgi:RNA polymerase sigma factor (sigma-70 family)